MNILLNIFPNRIFWSTIAVWVIAQCIKVVVGVIYERRFNFKWFVGTGGMPSSHAAGVSALATAVGVEQGFTTPLFAVTFIVAVIIMFDAQGVRRSSGKQAEVLNRIMDDLYAKRGVREERLKELLGHTPIQVIVGSLLGSALSLFFMRV